VGTNSDGLRIVLHWVRAKLNRTTAFEARSFSASKTQFKTLTEAPVRQGWSLWRVITFSITSKKFTEIILLVDTRWSHLSKNVNCGLNTAKKNSNTHSLPPAIIKMSGALSIFCIHTKTLWSK
jgi:hypothetical protein